MRLCVDQKPVHAHQKSAEHGRPSVDEPFDHQIQQAGAQRAQNILNDGHHDDTVTQHFIDKGDEIGVARRMIPKIDDAPIVIIEKFKGQRIVFFAIDDGKNKGGVMDQVGNERQPQDHGEHKDRA
jgi:hypothetical protein